MPVEHAELGCKRAFQPEEPLSCGFTKMGRSAYWKAGSDSLASAALGDANRGAFLALQSR